MELPLELSDSETNDKTLTEEEKQKLGVVVRGRGRYVRQCWHVSGFLPERERAEGSSSSSSGTRRRRRVCLRVNRRAASFCTVTRVTNTRLLWTLTGDNTSLAARDEGWKGWAGPPCDAGETIGQFEEPLQRPGRDRPSVITPPPLPSPLQQILV